MHHRRTHAFAIDDRLIGAGFNRVLIDAQTGRRVRLGVNVHQEHALAIIGQICP